MPPTERAESPIGLRAQKKRQTRLDLCMAARRLAVEHGLDATTVEDIAKVVGVSPRTFFNYYDTKLDAVVGPIEEIGNAHAREVFIGGGPSGVLIEDLTWLFASAFEPETEVREAISLVIELIKAEPRVFAAFMAAGVRQEAIVGDLLSARAGAPVAPEFAALAAGIMTTLTTRAAMTSAADSTKSLTAALHDHCAMAARLFDKPDDAQRRPAR
ncbi:TetR/AcrR family transcriptional regulator [Nocardia iowensis]|uniref:TetR/AcrR family transcriptional regulator n=1 Tax=Nocardia iowensis TaxID=204891 RepID=A0ABX8RM13_NOCIO|nr:TetR/AcrR family transcriptional regulator [Nocardia iowensis]QXN90670.1 TetR/AcrR family transcriptional regulator [Nocardia iowensis]